MLLLQLLLLLLLLGSFSTTTVSHTSSAPLPSRSSLQSILLLLNFIGFLLFLFDFIFCLVFFFYDLPRLFFLNLFCRIPKSARAKTNKPQPSVARPKSFVRSPSFSRFRIRRSCSEGTDTRNNKPTNLPINNS